jgi:hypothetical protein
MAVTQRWSQGAFTVQQEPIRAPPASADQAPLPGQVMAPVGDAVNTFGLALEEGGVDDSCFDEAGW